jgi:serine/threonine-protein kinase
MLTTPRIHTQGQLIGERYEVQAFVGEGGMQEVYKAYDRTLDREVALKVPKTASAGRRFKRSAELSARVSHPNAAKTLDYDDAGTRAYLIEEFIEGQPLRQVRDSIPIMDPYLVAHLFHHIARGVAASHHVEVVHRDLKPGNIMVSPGLTFASIKVTDFGIAKMAQEELAAAVEGGEESISGSQTMMGALPYMSPEMIEDPTKTGTPSDVWAIGAICFELLCDLKPFGKGLKAVREIQTGRRSAFPNGLRNPQFNGLLDELLKLVDRCLVVDVGLRISIDGLVKECDRLCYPETARATGTVDSMPGKSWGFIDPLDGGSSVFFHRDSVYGPSVVAGDTVCFSAHEGDPKARAHPVVKIA